VRTVVLDSFYIMQRSCICSLSQRQWANFLTAMFAKGSEEVGYGLMQTIREGE